VPINEALEKARDYELDLVEVSPTSRPPVCRILDFGKYKYEQTKKEKQARKRQHSFQMKEMRYRPKIDEHDYQFKGKHVREFLMSGSKVRAYVMFRGRELAYTEKGKELLERVAQDMADIALVDVPIKREGRNMSMILGPNPETLKMLRDARPAQKASAAKKPESEDDAKPEKKPDAKPAADDAAEAQEAASSTSGTELER